MRSPLPKTVTSSPARPARKLPRTRPASASSSKISKVSKVSVLAKKTDAAVAGMVRRGTIAMTAGLLGGTRRGPHARRLPDAAPGARIPVESRIVLRAGGVTFR